MNIYFGNNVKVLRWLDSAETELKHRQLRAETLVVVVVEQMT